MNARKRKAPEPPAEFNPHKPPLSACWWMQRFVDHFVADVTSKIERGDPHARAGVECIFVGALSYACRLTEEQSDGLLAVFQGKTAAEWKELLEERTSAAAAREGNPNRGGDGDGNG